MEWDFNQAAMTPFEDEGVFKMGDSKDTSYGRSAYILVYEKKKKRPLSVEFPNTEEGKKNKERLLKDYVSEDKRAEVTEEVRENIIHLSIPYYGIKPYIPPALDGMVRDDNFKFMIEQQVYSKEFLNFVTKISAFPSLNDPLAGTTLGYLVENQLPEAFKELLFKVLKVQMSLFHTVLARSDENYVDHLNAVRRTVHSEHDASGFLFA